MGDAYKSLSRYEQAIQAYEQALAILSKMKNLQGEGFVRSALGDTYTRLSRYEQSIEHSIWRSRVFVRHEIGPVSRGAFTNWPELNVGRGRLRRHAPTSRRV
ncbi:MAG: tetratricopeptide repeat protein [Acidobacteria bacterium]|nr:tetratricopeptide repeat protein [Acidobacteriota bacterium]